MSGGECRLLLVYEEIVMTFCFFFFQAEDGIRDLYVTGVQTCALPILALHRTTPAGDEQRVLRLGTSRARPRRRQGLPRAVRRHARRALAADRPGRLVDLERQLAGRVHDDGGAALLQR